VLVNCARNRSNSFRVQQCSTRLARRKEFSHIPSYGQRPTFRHRGFACPFSPDRLSAMRMMRLSWIGIGFFLFTLFAAGCAQKIGVPSPSPSGTEAPVALRNLQVVSVDGHRAVLLRFSRVPTMVRRSSGKDPGRIVIQAWGPSGDGDLPERTLPQVDPEINDVRVSRHDGALEVVLDFKSVEPPPYSVHEMADWVMVRLGVPQEG
jgi:hypothetical protein